MDPADPVDAAETRALALDELDRMHRLADDLVMLARSGRPDFVVVRRATDVHDLTRAVFEHAQQLGDRAWRLVAAAQGVVDVDDQRLTQRGCSSPPTR
jgi:signal transduction histidine kinase